MTAAPAVTVRRAGPGDVAVVAALVADAFHDLPPSRWLVPEQHARRSILERYFRIWCGYAIAYGHIDILTDNSAAAVWVHHPTEGLPDPADYLQRRATATGAWLPRFALLDQALAEHGKRADYDHLLYLAVRRDKQRTGRGRMLLDHHLRHLDRVNWHAYLEAADEPLVAVYEQFGYDAGLPIALPDGPNFWPMWRQPHQP